MNELICLRGVAGSGKSSYAAKHFPLYSLREADQFFITNGVYNWRKELIREAHQWCQAAVYSDLAEGKNVIVKGCQ